MPLSHITKLVPKFRPGNRVKIIKDWTSASRLGLKKDRSGWIGTVLKRGEERKDVPHSFVVKLDNGWGPDKSKHIVYAHRDNLQLVVDGVFTDNTCTCDIYAVMRGGCPSARGLPCPSI